MINLLLIITLPLLSYIFQNDSLDYDLGYINCERGLAWTTWFMYIFWRGVGIYYEYQYLKQQSSKAMKWDEKVPCQSKIWWFLYTKVLSEELLHQDRMLDMIFVHILFDTKHFFLFGFSLMFVLIDIIPRIVTSCAAIYVSYLPDDSWIPRTVLSQVICAAECESFANLAEFHGFKGRYSTLESGELYKESFIPY